MGDSVIHIENLGKQYLIGASNTDSLREQLTHMMSNVFRRNKQKQEPHSFWALKDINLDIKAGEVLGIIGHNGAGKSTLLKILSRITHPTTGKIMINGRTASLLEVGTGFHPELTGRENIFMNAAVLGMKRAETRRRFDEIVDFAEVGQFIDTPVKRYSSGMYMRLAFAVAAHLEPEILIVDEVLAVGDVAFQKKSLGKMSDVASKGRTVLFVSHNVGAISSLCTRAVQLDKGQIVKVGNPAEVIENYVSSADSLNTGERIWEAGELTSERIELRAVRLLCDNEITTDVNIAKPVSIEVDYKVLKSNIDVNVGVQLYNNTGTGILSSVNFPSASINTGTEGTNLSEGFYRSICTIPANYLNDISYHIHVQLVTDMSRLEVNAENAITFVVHDTGEMRKEYTGGWLGLVRPKLPWGTTRIE